jgi:hypothetical protein
MDTVIGLGKAGCAIADRFTEFSQYDTYKLDIDIPEGPRSFVLKQHEKIEDYEEKCPDLATFFADLEGEVLFVVGGGGKVMLLRDMIITTDLKTNLCCLWSVVVAKYQVLL